MTVANSDKARTRGRGAGRRKRRRSNRSHSRSRSRSCSRSRMSPEARAVARHVRFKEESGPVSCFHGAGWLDPRGPSDEDSSLEHVLSDETLKKSNRTPRSRSRPGSQDPWDEASGSQDKQDSLGEESEGKSTWRDWWRCF